MRTAVKADMPALFELYDICFPGEADFARSFLTRLWTPQSTYLIEQNGEIASAYHALPISMQAGGRVYSGEYVFAAATLPQYRARGLMAELLRSSFDRIKATGGSFSALLVQESSLIEYYSRLGYSETFHMSVHDIASGRELLMCEDPDIAELSACYEASVSGNTFAKRPPWLWREILSSYTAYFSRTGGELSYCIGELRGDTFAALEAFGNNAEALCAAAASAQNAAKCSLRFPAPAGIPTGCIKTVDASLAAALKDPYLNLYFN